MANGAFNQQTRQAAVAGMFYPSDSGVLSAEISRCISAVNLRLPYEEVDSGLVGVIAPHAGYIYSGEVAACLYRLLPTSQKKVAVIGPSHRVSFSGVSAPSCALYSTPLGDVPVDQEGIASLVEAGAVDVSDAPHALEHSVEVQVPFLQYLLPEFTLIPLVVGDATVDEVAAILSRLRTMGYFLVISSDLSHFLSYDEACVVDARTSQKICQNNWRLHGEEACGCRAINGLLKLAAEKAWSVRDVVYLNSGDTAGDRSRVVGYGAFSVHDHVPNQGV